MNLLVLLPHEKDSLNNTIYNENVDYEYIFKESGFFVRVFRRVCFYLSIFKETFFAFSVTKVKSADVVLIYQCLYPLDVIKEIRKVNKNCRIIFFCWGSVVDMRDKFLYKGQKMFRSLLNAREILKFEIWSFDKNDCDTYDLKYNNQMCVYFYDLKDVQIQYDVAFIGFEKGRLDTLKNIKQILNNYGITSYIKVLPMRYKRYSEYDCDFFLQRKEIPYFDFLKMELKGKVLLEIVQEGQSDITWRALEALFYNKKIITNCSRIKEYDFYKAENVFLLGEDDMDRLPEFVAGKFIPVENYIIEKYKLKKWILNFGIEI